MIQTSFNNTYKTFIQIGYLILTVILIGSVYFYQERVFYTDSANQLFHMVNEKSFTIFVERYSMYLNQSLPMIFVALGSSIKTIGLSYSISFILVHILCFTICWYIFKNIEACILILTCLIMYRHAFYHAISETYMFMAYGALFYAFLSYQVHAKMSNVLFFVISIFLILLNYFMHPVTLFTTLFALVFIPLFYNEYRKPKYYILLVFLLCIYLQKFFFPGETHNTSFFDELKHADIILPNIFTSYPIHFIMHRTNIYSLPLLLLGISTAIYVYHKKWLLLTFQLLFIIGFFLITAITFHNGDSDMSMEARFAPLYFFIALPLFAIAKENMKVFTLTFTITILMLGYSLAVIYNTGIDGYSSRLDYLTSIVNKAAITYPNKKFIVKFNDLNKDKLLVVWGSSYETMLLSTLNDPKNCVSLFIEEDNVNLREQVYTEKDLFLYTTWWAYHSQNELNKERFDLKELPYKRITSELIEKIPTE